MSDLDAVRHDLDLAVAALDDLRAAMRAGEEVDLDAFNLMVAKSCKAAVELPQADAPKVRGHLERLLARLNEAKAEIEAEQARIEARPPTEPADEAAAAAAVGADDSEDGTPSEG